MKTEKIELKESSRKLLATLLLLVVKFVTILLHAAVLTAMYTWFVVPTLGVPTVSILQMLGVVMFFKLMFFRPLPKSSAEIAAMKCGTFQQEFQQELENRWSVILFIAASAWILHLLIC